MWWQRPPSDLSQRSADGMRQGCRGFSSAVLCQMNGRGSSFQVAAQDRMASSSSLVERWVPRRNHLVVSSANHLSTRFSQEL